MNGPDVINSHPPHIHHSQFNVRVLYALCSSVFLKLNFKKHKNIKYTECQNRTVWNVPEAPEESLRWLRSLYVKKEIIHLNLDLLPIMFLLKNRLNSSYTNQLFCVVQNSNYIFV